MNQYTVLLVDDEEEVFQVIMKKLDWESMGFSIAGYARNGVEALEMAEELQPDVVMTDIKMPYMDGLTLCKKLKELYQKVKVIIFSGFDEFEYAKEAIKIEAEEYILKPINSNELREVFERIKVNLDKELDEKRNIDKLREYYMESLPVLQENFYTSLIEGRIPESQIEKYVQNYQINLTGPYYVVTVLHISTTNPENVPIDPFLLTVSVKKLAEEQLTEKWNCRTVTYLGDILVIAQLSDVDSVTHFTDGSVLQNGKACLQGDCHRGNRSCVQSAFAAFTLLSRCKECNLLSCFIWKYKSHQYRRDGSTGERG